MASSVSVTPYIVNGTNANLVNYPNFASLFYRTSSVYSTSSFCGATMINSQYALTAAHCIYGEFNTMLYTVVVPNLEDEDNFLSAAQVKAVEFYYPDDYVESQSQLWPNDIAIIKVEAGLTVPDYFSLLNSTTDTNYPAGSGYKAVGHGNVATNQTGGSVLLETDLTFVDNTTCRGIYGNALSSKQICFDGVIGASSLKNATCSGDSGGPVYQYVGSQYIQIGLTSFGPAVCGNPSSPVVAVFTEVYDYIGWISNVINGLETPKYYITTQNGVRSLVDNSGHMAATEPTPVQENTSNQTGGGGGAVEEGLLFAILFLNFFYRRHRWRKS
nr:trypsin-like serine protease [Vibrio sonorensis]